MLRDKLIGYKIILASGSPRRQQFFKDLDVDFEIRLREVDEVYPADLMAEEITNYLARLKADAFNGTLAEGDILVTSDTIVWHNKKALGKPKDYNDAVNILKSLANSTHDVITSVCFQTLHTRDVIYDVTKVSVGKLTDEMIAYYINNYKPFDKAGSYGIQEWIGFVAVEKIEGSYTNVMGLPTAKVYHYLNTFKSKNQ